MKKTYVAHYQVFIKETKDKTKQAFYIALKLLNFKP